LWAGRERERRGSASHLPSQERECSANPPSPQTPTALGELLALWHPPTHQDRTGREAPQPHADREAANSRTNLALCSAQTYHRPRALQPCLPTGIAWWVGRDCTSQKQVMSELPRKGSEKAATVSCSGPAAIKQTAVPDQCPEST